MQKPFELKHGTITVMALALFTVWLEMFIPFW